MLRRFDMEEPVFRCIYFFRFSPVILQGCDCKFMLPLHNARKCNLALLVLAAASRPVC